MQLTYDQIQEIADLAAAKAIEAYVSSTPLPVYRSKAAIGRAIGRTAKTVSKLIDQNKIEVLPHGGYRLASGVSIKPRKK